MRETSRVKLGISGVICLASFLCLFIAETVGAATMQTSGGVNWIDTMGYTKPAFVSITLPDETTCPNKYYVNLTGGSGTTCSQASPCGSLSAVAGKAGTTGGPAYIYVKGSGSIGLTGTLYGNAGAEIVIKPWPGETSVVNLKGPNYIESGNIRYLVFDGGPGLLFSFNGSSGYGEGNSNGMALIINSNYLTFYRCRILVNGGTGGVNIARNSGNVTGTTFINNEFYDNLTPNGTAPLMYPGGGNNCSGSSTANNTTVRNNIFRNAGPEAIEFNPRTLSDGVVIDGNAFHNIGKASCGGAWACRPAVVIDGPSCGGQTRNVTITNNLMWDLGSGGIWDRGGASSSYYYNNAIYDYGKGSGSGGPNPQGISGYSSGGSATVRNNIIYSPNGTAPFDGSRFQKSNNVCSGCDKSWSSGTFVSMDPSSADFLKIGSSSAAKDAGTSVVGVNKDYLGAARPAGAAYDIGAFEYGAEGGQASTAPSPPSNLRIIVQN
jgi:hypothetical protein